MLRPVISDSISSNSAPTLTIKNTQIYNSTNFGILGRETNLTNNTLLLYIYDDATVEKIITLNK